MILVNEVASSSTDGAIDSTVIARISVIELLGRAVADGDVHVAVAGHHRRDRRRGVRPGPVGAAEAGPASRTAATVHSSGEQQHQRRTPTGRRGRRRRGAARGQRVMACGPSARAAGARSVPQPLRSKTEPASAPLEVRAASAGRRPPASAAAVGGRRGAGTRRSASAASTASESTSASRVTCSSVAPTTRTTSAMRTTLTVLDRPMRWRATTSMRPLPWPRPASWPAGRRTAARRR